MALKLASAFAKLLPQKINGFGDKGRLLLFSCHKRIFHQGDWQCGPFAENGPHFIDHISDRPGFFAAIEKRVQRGFGVGVDRPPRKIIPIGTKGKSRNPSLKE